MGPIRILVASDRRSSRTNISAFLRTDSDVIVLAEAFDVSEAISKAHDLKLEAIMIYLRSNGTNSLQAISQIRASLPTPITVVLADSDKENDVFRMPSYVIQSYLLKGSSITEISYAFKKATAREVVLSPASTPC